MVARSHRLRAGGLLVSHWETTLPPTCSPALLAAALGLCRPGSGARGKIVGPAPAGICVESYQESRNPFAMVVLKHLVTRQTRQNPREAVCREDQVDQGALTEDKTMYDAREKAIRDLPGGGHELRPPRRRDRRQDRIDSNASERSSISLSAKNQVLRAMDLPQLESLANNLQSQIRNRTSSSRLLFRVARHGRIKCDLLSSAWARLWRRESAICCHPEGFLITDSGLGPLSPGFGGRRSPWLNPLLPRDEPGLVVSGRRGG